LTPNSQFAIRNSQFAIRNSQFIICRTPLCQVSNLRNSLFLEKFSLRFPVKASGLAFALSVARTPQPEAAATRKTGTDEAPVSGEELPHSKFTKIQGERFDFDPADTGKTAYFCIRLENMKGGAGPDGALQRGVPLTARLTPVSPSAGFDACLL
jgi:hypothetical protein